MAGSGGAWWSTCRKDERITAPGRRWCGGGPAENGWSAGCPRPPIERRPPARPARTEGPGTAATRRWTSRRSAAVCLVVSRAREPGRGQPRDQSRWCQDARAKIWGPRTQPSVGTTKANTSQRFRLLAVFSARNGCCVAAVPGLVHPRAPAASRKAQEDHPRLRRL